VKYSLRVVKYLESKKKEDITVIYNNYPHVGRPTKEEQFLKLSNKNKKNKKTKN
jgi:hypothetical protein